MLSEPYIHLSVSILEDESTWLLISDNNRIFCNFEDDKVENVVTFSSRCRFRTDGSASGTWEKVTGSIPDVTYAKSKLNLCIINIC